MDYIQVGYMFFEIIIIIAGKFITLESKFENIILLNYVENQ